jgi:transposase-like protein
MRDSKNTEALTLLVTEHARCPRCSLRMVLTGLEPGRQGYDLRTFECAKCNYARSVAVESDPMNARTSRWIFGELKPPT